VVGLVQYACNIQQQQQQQQQPAAMSVIQPEGMPADPAAAARDIIL